ncbi:MAG: hypothetical protein ILP14_00780 [Oscillospiraceae bacterium]|nr:hypothetical protein [Oscillospiraceae bacterium]
MDRMFETEHMIVRKFKEEDAQELYENHMDDEVMLLCQDLAQNKVR